METHGEMNHRPGARPSAGSQRCCRPVGFSSATTVEFTAAANTEDKYRVIVYLDATKYETFCAYAAFKRADAEYLLAALIELRLAPDPKFVEWRQKNPQSFLPPNSRPVQRPPSTGSAVSRHQLRRPTTMGRRAGNGRGPATQETDV
jgi:hypothetical protein